MRTDRKGADAPQSPAEGGLLRARYRALVPAATFLSGAAILAFELAAPRLLAPVFGATLYVWTAVISTTLLSLTAGYLVAGALADRRGEPARRMVVALLAAALLLAVLPWFDRSVVGWAMEAGLRWGSVVASLLLLGPALFFLGMVGVFAVASLTRAGMASGRAAGSVMALSTLGGVSATLAAGFWAIPTFAVDRILGALAALVGLAACLGVAAVWGRRGGAGMLLAVAGAAGGLWHAAGGGGPLPGVLFDRPSVSGEVKVIDFRGTRLLLIDNIPQTGMALPDGGTRWPYVHIVAGHPMLMRGGVGRAMVIGMGGGLVADLLRRWGAKVDEVEVDPAVRDAAERFFGSWTLDRGADELLTIEDGRRAVAATPAGRYDLIVVDAYAAESIPAHLVTAEFFGDCRRALSPQGILALNLVDVPGGALHSAVEATLRSVFGRVAAFLSEPAESSLDQNILVFSSDGALALDPAAREGPATPDPYRIVELDPRCYGPFMGAVGSGRILRDRHGPDPRWDVAVREAWRRTSWEKLPRSLLGAE